jgi:hypothetical protein
MSEQNRQNFNALISTIVVPENRDRRQFDETALNELADSMRRIGLINPIIVSDDSDRPVLVAGERRLRAAKALGWETTLSSATTSFASRKTPPGPPPRRRSRSALARRPPRRTFA